MSRGQVAVFGAGLAALLLFTALMAVIAVDYLTPGDISPVAALALAAGVVLCGAALIAGLLRRKIRSGGAL